MFEILDKTVCNQCGQKLRLHALVTGGSPPLGKSSTDTSVCISPGLTVHYMCTCIWYTMHTIHTDFITHTYAAYPTTNQKYVNFVVFGTNFSCSIGADRRPAEALGDWQLRSTHVYCYKF